MRPNYGNKCWRNLLCQNTKKETLQPLKERFVKKNRSYRIRENMWWARHRTANFPLLETIRVRRSWFWNECFYKPSNLTCKLNIHMIQSSDSQKVSKVRKYFSTALLCKYFKKIEIIFFMYLSTFLQFCLNCLVNDIDWVVIYNIGFLRLEKLAKTLRFFLMTLAISKYSNGKDDIRNGITSSRPFSFKENKWYLNIHTLHTKYSLKYAYFKVV